MTDRTHYTCKRCHKAVSHEAKNHPCSTNARIAELEATIARVEAVRDRMMEVGTPDAYELDEALKPPGGET